MFSGVIKPSISSYDTAWVTMVPSGQHSPNLRPLFPQCLKWVMDNQNSDGSWSSIGHNPSHPLLVKENLSSTMACILALQQWKVGDLLVKRGLDFVARNSWAIKDEHQLTPIGFDITFPKMVQSSMEAGLNPPIETASVKAMLHRREMEIERCCAEKKDVYLAYVAEGVLSHRRQDWSGMIMNHQMQNGSFFGSPSTTASALIATKNESCSNYLRSVLEVYGDAVPANYPSGIYFSLHVVDKLQKMGLDHYSTYEIQKVLSQIYRCWLQMDEEIFSNGACCAMAFRLLRMHGYEVSSDALVNFDEEGKFLESIDAVVNNTSTILELYEASEFTVSSEELVLDKIFSWTSSCLKRQLSDGTINDKALQKEVGYALAFRNATLDRVKGRMTIEHYDENHMQLAKTSYRYMDAGDSANVLAFAVEDFNKLQAVHREEIKQLQMWFKRSKLDRLKYSRQAIVYYYFFIMSLVPQLQFSEARISWVKTVAAITVMDDFFDFHGSAEEIQNVADLFEKWEQPSSVGFYSLETRIIYSAVYDMINDLGARASIMHGWNVKDYFHETWLDLVKCMKKEAEWSRYRSTPMIDEYMSIGCRSIGIRPSNIAFICFMEPKLSKNMVLGQEFKNLLNLTGIIARLSNDLYGGKREESQNTVNSVSLYIAHGLAEDKEMAMQEIRRDIERNRRELLRILVQQTDEIKVPKAYKEALWKICKLSHALYSRGDGFSTCPTEMMKAMKATIDEPLHFPPFYV